MSNIKILCTSTGCIEYAPARYRDLNIGIIRIHVLFDGKEYKEGLDLDPVEFYHRLETIEDPKNHLPSTALPDTEDIREAFETAIRDGYDECIPANTYGISAMCRAKSPFPIWRPGPRF